MMAPENISRSTIAAPSLSLRRASMMHSRVNVSSSHALSKFGSGILGHIATEYD